MAQSGHSESLPAKIYQVMTAIASGSRTRLVESIPWHLPPLIGYSSPGIAMKRKDPYVG